MPGEVAHWLEGDIRNAGRVVARGNRSRPDIRPRGSSAQRGGPLPDAIGQKLAGPGVAGQRGGRRWPVAVAGRGARGPRGCAFCGRPEFRCSTTFLLLRSEEICCSGTTLPVFS
jgi:hypothetical protein